jgi:regulatory protein
MIYKSPCAQTLPSFTSKRRGPKRNDDGSIQKPKQSATGYLLWLLSRRDASAATLRDKLIRRGYSPEEAEVALAYAQESRYQSDDRFAETKVNAGAGRYGNYRLKQTLRGKGVAADLVDEKLDTLEPETDRARRVAERFKGKPFTQELRQKAQRFLIARGFGSSAIREAIAWLKENASAVESADTEDFEPDHDYAYES